jgi:hypothetical protein
LSTKTPEQFLEEAHAIHGDTYDYSSVEYTNGKSRVTILCPKHGEFHQIARNHLKGHKCPSCKGLGKDKILEIINLNMPKGLTLLNPKEIRVTASEAFLLCDQHGFLTKRAGGLMSGHGCRLCHFKSLLKTKEDVLEGFSRVHGDRYDYSEFDYQHSRVKSTVICKRHGPFKITQKGHRDGRGCRACALESGGFHSVPAAEKRREEYLGISCYLYFLLLGESFYKIGISRNIKKRKQELERASGLAIKEVRLLYTNAYQSVKMEKLLHEMFPDKRITNHSFAGHTECFYLSQEDVEKVNNFIDKMKFIYRSKDGSFST